eukprot:1146466-Pelagomonas_calceolata.AAC.8
MNGADKLVLRHPLDLMGSSHSPTPHWGTNRKLVGLNPVSVVVVHQDRERCHAACLEQQNNGSVSSPEPTKFGGFRKHLVIESA